MEINVVLELSYNQAHALRLEQRALKPSLKLGCFPLLPCYNSKCEQGRMGNTRQQFLYVLQELMKAGAVTQYTCVSQKNSKRNFGAFKKMVFTSF